MAKSKSGGTRSYIRGRVGADVYSIGKDAKGSNQQVVRSLAETVANPQTVAQMTGRMIMATVMQALSCMKPIIDHSFDNVPKGQPSLSEFISRNYALIKADVAAHPASDNAFALVKYHCKGYQPGNYVVSDGEAVIPSGWDLGNGHMSIKLNLPANPKISDLQAAWALTTKDYLTMFSFEVNDPLNEDEGFSLITARISLKEGLTGTTALTNDNIASCFNVEGNVTPEISLDSTGDTPKAKIHVNPSAESAYYGQQFYLVSIKDGEGFKHSPCSITTGSLSVNPADEVLPTYPIGSEMYLNGGDL